VVRGKSEILDFGQEERLFNRAQRRAIRFRHGHVCAVKGCGRRITHIHHVYWYENGGETCIANGVPLCSYHHHLVHDRGWIVDWNGQTGVLRFIGPKGQLLESNAEFVPRLAA
jgi:predicted restriction endonuclease